MENQPRLVLIHNDLSSVSIRELKKLEEEITIHTENSASPSAWEEVIRDSFEKEFSYKETITNRNGYAGEGVFFAMLNGEDCATASAMADEEFPDFGCVHMIGTKKKARGRKLGYYCVLSALCYLKEKGYKKAIIRTDDFRIPAIKTYLKLGLVPYMTHESHELRWKKIMDNLK